MPVRLHCFGIAFFALAVCFAMMLTTSKAEAQTANCTSMGAGMVHCDTIGSGGMASTDCMAMGPDMATCNSIGGGSGSGGRAASPVAVYRAIFGDKTRKTVGRMLADGDCQGAFKYAFEKGRQELIDVVVWVCQRSGARTSPQFYAPQSRAPAYGQGPTSSTQSAVGKDFVPFPADPLPPPVPLAMPPVPRPAAPSIRPSQPQTLGRDDMRDLREIDPATNEAFPAPDNWSWSVAPPEPWVLVATGVDGSKYYINQKSFKPYTFSNHGWEFWEKVDRSQVKNRDYYESLAIKQISCDRRLQRTIEIIDYDELGKVISQFHRDDYNSNNLKSIPPDSVGDAIYRAVCQ